MRNEEMFGSAATMIWCCLPTLLLLREAAGATYFHLHETKDMTLTCNESFGENGATWWNGKHKSSLQIFDRWCDYQNGNLKTRAQKCLNHFSLSNFPGGGIFACKSPVGLPLGKNEGPLFSSIENCTAFNFFIVAIIKSPEGQRSENVHGKAEENITIEEKQNFTLSCEFELGKDATIFAVYWFKETKPSKCLFSASNEDDFSYDVNCCIDDAFRDRRINDSSASGDQRRNKTFAVTVTNSTTADNGSYFCLVAAYHKKYTWTIQRTVSVTVKEASPPPNPKTSLLIPLALAGIAGALLLLIGGLILFFCCKDKAKGKPLENQQRDQTTVATDDCSPYAISSRNDLNGQEMVYSLATGPGEAPSALCFSPQSKPAPGVRHRENVEVLYSKVLKDKNGPSLASDSSV